MFCISDFETRFCFRLQHQSKVLFQIKFVVSTKRDIKRDQADQNWEICNWKRSILHCFILQYKLFITKLNTGRVSKLHKITIAFLIVPQIQNRPQKSELLAPKTKYFAIDKKYRQVIKKETWSTEVN